LYALATPWLPRLPVVDVFVINVPPRVPEFPDTVPADTPNAESAHNTTPINPHNATMFFICKASLTYAKFYHKFGVIAIIY
jgi:hypothetical protein